MTTEELTKLRDRLIQEAWDGADRPIGSGDAELIRIYVLGVEDLYDEIMGL